VLAKRLEREGRLATPAEQEMLSKYVGFGASEVANGLFPRLAGANAKDYMPRRLDLEWRPIGEQLRGALTDDELNAVMASTQFAHYTSEDVTRAIWGALQQFGFTGGTILEPGMGHGAFPMAAPVDLSNKITYTGIERDPMTGLIGRQLIQAGRVITADYIKQKLPNDLFDVAVGNPPFARTAITSDPDYRKHKFLLHDYFFAKTLDKLRPGGVMAFVTSAGTMNKGSEAARQYMADRADLVGAIRLPNTAFKQNAGTEVTTDILFFRKRMPDEAVGGEKWLGLETVRLKDSQGQEQDTLINEYFVAHPDMVLGTNALTGSMYSANTYTVEATPGANLAEQLKEATSKLPSNIYVENSTGKANTLEGLTAQVDLDPNNRKEGGIYLSDKGEIMLTRSGAGLPLSASTKLSAKDVTWLKGTIKLRDLLKVALDDQRKDGPWEKSLKALNTAYTAFVKVHGPLRTFTVSESTKTDEDGVETTTITKRYKNKRLLGIDVESPLLYALERETDDGSVVPSDGLTKRSIAPPKEPVIETVNDALLVSLNRIGRLDIDQVAALAKITPAQVIDQLGDLIYEDPLTGWDVADAYLSGDVVTKLEQAKAAATADPQFNRNVEALEKVQPIPLAPSDIAVRLGMAWMDAAIVDQFALEVLGERAQIKYSGLTGQWETGASRAKHGRYRGAQTEWGHADRSPMELLDALLNNRELKVTRTVKNGSSTTTVTDQDATTAINEIAQRMAERFSSWVWEDADRAEALAAKYNALRNRIVPRSFAADFVNPPGLALKFKNLHPHQLRAIWRQIQTGDTYLAHAVGAGKTLEMVIGAMEQKRLGLISKPMFSVPNHMLGQFAAEFLEAYPAANIMVADEENFSKERRQQFVAAATVNGPDAIIISHSALKLLRVKPESSKAVVEDMLAELDAALKTMAGDNDRITRKKLEQQREAIAQRFEGKTGDEKKDDVVFFEDIGVDFMYVDEAHEFRKLDFVTNRTTIKGINPIGSQQALDLFIKLRYLHTQRPGRSKVLASGTPITNTMGELYTVQKYMDYDALREAGLHHFDAWSAEYGEVVGDYERNAAGQYKRVERFAKFNNLPELMLQVRELMDVLTSDQLGELVTRPDIIGGKPNMVVSEASSTLTQYMKGELSQRIEVSLKWKPSPQEKGNPDPMLAIISDARLAVIDMRFIYNDLPNDPNSKLNKMIDGMIADWKAGKDTVFVDKDGNTLPGKGDTQIVFSPIGFGSGVTASRGFDARAWVMKRLKEAGIPADQVAWMSDYKTAPKKQAMFREMRSAKKRILIGSPANMGTGVNVQLRLKNLHFLSPPWFPSDVEQPTGRILRQGNLNKDIGLNWYVTEGTYDSTGWGMVARKGKFIEQAMRGDKQRSAEDISEVSQYALASALASGDERMIEVAELEGQIGKLTNLQRDHSRNTSDARATLSSVRNDLSYHQNKQKKLDAAVAFVGDDYLTADAFTFEVDGLPVKGKDRAEMAPNVVTALLKDVPKFHKGAPNETTEVGKLMGKYPLVIEVRHDFGTKDVLVMPQMDVGGFPVDLLGRPLFASAIKEFSDTDSLGLTTRMINAVNRISGTRDSSRNRVSDAEHQIKVLEKRINAPFPEERALFEKVAKLKQLQKEMADESKAAEEAKNAVTNTPAFSRQGADGATVGGAGIPQGLPTHATAATETLERAFATLGRSDGSPPRFRAVRPDSMPDALSRALAALERFTGAKIAVIRNVNPEASGIRFNGVTLRKGTLYVDETAQHPATTVASHEFVHQLRTDNPALYATLEAEVRRQGKLPAYIANLEKRGETRAQEIALEELTADAVGDALTDRLFLRAMAKRNPSKFKQLADALLAFLDTMLGKVRDLGSSKYLTDVQAFRDVLADVMEQHAGGTTTDTDTPAFSSLPAPVYYSALLTAIDKGQGAPKKADAAAWRGWLDGAVRRGEIKQSERDWLGLDTWLAAQDKPITREALADYVRANKVEVTETVLGELSKSATGLPDGWRVAPDDMGVGFVVLDQDGNEMSWADTAADAIEDAQDPDARDDARRAEGAATYGAYTIDGPKRDYKEVLLTLPSGGATYSGEVHIPKEQLESDPHSLDDLLTDISAAGFEELDYGAVREEDMLEFTDWPEGQYNKLTRLAEQYDGELNNVTVKGDVKKPVYTTGHFPAQSNVIAHVRLDERDDADGPLLFLEEIQSDWHQDGRKQGYGGKTEWVVLNKNTRQYVAWVGSEDEAKEVIEKLTAERNQEYVAEEHPIQDTGVPDAPFKNTAEWAMLAFKRAVRYAAEKGIKRIAWTTGKQQADRYSLAKTIERVEYTNENRLIAYTVNGDLALNETVAEDKIETYIGKEAAKNLLAQNPRHHSGLPSISSRSRVLLNVDLKLGGEGMAGFYDKILPTEVNKWAKKFGGKVGTARINTRTGDNLDVSIAYDRKEGFRYVIYGVESEKAYPTAGEALAVGTAIMDRKRTEVHSLDITPAMHAAAMEGQPMFSRRDQEAPEGIHHIGGRVGNFADKIGTKNRHPLPGRFDEAQRSAAEKFATFAPGKSLRQRYDALRASAAARFTQKVIDQFRPLRDLNPTAFMQAHLSKGTDGALEAAFHHGIPVLKDGAYSVAGRDGGFRKVLADLGGEHDQFLMWVVGNRAEGLLAEGREQVFTEDDIAAMKRLNQGTMENGTSRQKAYSQALSGLNRYNKAFLDIAESAGLIDAESRAVWEDGFYIPFYRAMEDDPANAGPGQVKGLLRQRVIERLVGGQEPLGDPLENILANWSQMLTASMKNLAANAALDAGVKAKIATPSKTAGKGTVWTMRDGVEHYWRIHDPMVLEALESLSFNGYDNPLMRAAGKFKRVLTTGVTINPSFRIRNLARDVISAMATSDVSYNPLRNITDGIRATHKDSETNIALMAGGGAVRFGAINDGDQASHAKRLIKMGVKEDQILDTQDKILNAFRGFYDWWAEVGDRSETINRAVIYQRALADGKSHLQASYEARDLLNFTSMGSAAGIRALTQVLPFFNARLQGTDRLIRGAKADPRRFAAVAGTVAMASALLFLLNKDDDDYKNLPDYVRDNYWPIKLGGKWFYLPKPFEIGAMGSIVERGTELAVSGDDYKAKDFAATLTSVLSSQLAMNPIPQIARPVTEAAFNYDLFRQAPIDSMGQQNLAPQDRFTSRTSAGAIAASRLTGISPQRLEHLVTGYLGWLGIQALNASDYMLRGAMDLPSNPRRDLTTPTNVFVLGDFVKEPTASSSKYLTRFYESQRHIDQIYASANQARKTGDAERDAELRDDPALRNRGIYKAADKQITRINKQIKTISNSTTLSATDKNRRIEELNRRRADIARRVDARARAAGG